jgi:type I restriction enzyme, R subunit
MSQFAFLKPEFPLVYEHSQRAEVMALSDPRGACFYARLALETAVTWMYQVDGSLRSPYDTALSALIHEPTFRSLVGNALVTKARLIKDFGNRAVHDNRKVSENTATVALRELFHFSYWLVRTYAKGEKPAAGLQFFADALPKTQVVEAKTLERAKALAADHDYSEAETRDYFIDLLLKEAGWPLDQARDREFESAGCRTSRARASSITCSGATTASRSGWSRPSARARRPRRTAAGEALRRLPGAQFGQRPVIFYSNGYEHWIWDDTATRRAGCRVHRSSRQQQLYADCLERDVRATAGDLLFERLRALDLGRHRRYAPRAVQGFYKKAELELLIQRRTTRRSLRRPDRSARHRRAPLPDPRHPPHRRGLRARPRPQGAAGHGHRLRQDAHGDRALRPAHALQLGQARALPRRPRGAGESGGQRLQAPPARRLAR